MTASRVWERADLGELTKLGQGGQGIVYAAPKVRIRHIGPAVYKEYKPDIRPLLNVQGLEYFVEFFRRFSRTQAQEFLQVASWPIRAIARDGDICGFLMPAVPDNFRAAFVLPSGRVEVRLAECE